MHVPQLIRSLNNDPDNLNIRFQLWKELLRTYPKPELTNIDISTPNPRNWKAILKLVHHSDDATRSTLIEILKPLLRQWPCGARPLLPNFIRHNHYLDKATLLSNGAWQLCDSITHRLSPPEYAVVMANGNSEIRELHYITGGNTQWTEAGKHERVFEIGAGFPRLEKLTLTTFESVMFEFLCEDSDPAKATRKSLRSLDIETWVVEPSPWQLLSYNDLRTNLEELTIHDVNDDLTQLFDFSWPDLSKLTIGLDSNTTFDRACSKSVTECFPKLKSVEVRNPSGYWCNDKACVQNLTQAFEQSANVEIMLTLSEYECNDPDIHAHIESISAAVVHVVLDLEYGYFVPPQFQNAKSIEIRWFGRSEYKPCDKVNFIRQFCATYQQLRELDIRSWRSSVEFLASTSIANLTALNKLVTRIDIDSSNIELAEQAFKNIAALPIQELELSITAEPNLDLEFVVFPSSMIDLSLTLDVGKAATLHCLSASRCLRSLYLHYHMTPKELLFQLRQSNYRDISVLRLCDLCHRSEDMTIYNNDLIESFKELEFPKLRLFDSHFHLIYEDKSWESLTEILIETHPDLFGPWSATECFEHGF